MKGEERPPTGEQWVAGRHLGDMGTGSIDALLSLSVLPYSQFMLRVLRMDPVGTGCPVVTGHIFNPKCLRQKPVPTRMGQSKTAWSREEPCPASLSRLSGGGFYGKRTTSQQCF